MIAWRPPRDRCRYTANHFGEPMTPEQARDTLAALRGAEEPTVLPRSVLADLSIDDVPDDVSFEIGSPKDGVIHLDWSGRLFKDKGQIVGEADYTWTRKYWYHPIGLEPYLDLVRRAVEIRAKSHGDVELTHFDDDGAYIQMTFLVITNENNVRKSYDHVRKVCAELEETAEAATDEVGRRIAEIGARLSGWGSESLDHLVESVEKVKTADERGRSLEELVSRLFEQIDGFTVTGRVRTATEEIDVSILNDSNDPRFRREAAILLAECKNWTDKCGKNEFVIFKEKVENRSRRCSLGFLVSWNGFKTTITKEMLRGSREDTLIVPITGKEIREAVRDNAFADVLARCWEKAIDT
jgi:hypothetical protein